MASGSEHSRSPGRHRPGSMEAAQQPASQASGPPVTGRDTGAGKLCAPRTHREPGGNPGGRLGGREVALLGHREAGTL